MSEAAPERKPPPGKQGTGFEKKAAGLPIWVWVVLAAGAAGAYYLWRKNSSSSSSAATPTTPDYSGQLAAIQSEIQALQGDESSTGTTSWTAHVSTKGQSFNQLVTTYGTSAAEFLQWQQESPATTDQIAKIYEWFEHPTKKQAGRTYYTPSTPTTTTTSAASDAATAAADTTGTAGAAGSAATGAGGLTPGAASVPAAPTTSPTGTSTSGNTKPKPKPKPKPRPKPRKVRSR